MKSVSLDRIQLAVSQRLSNHFLENTTEAEIINILSDRMFILIKGELLGTPIDCFSFKYPRDWKQAVKERFAPKWFLKRHPVRYKEKSVDIKQVYTEFKPALPNEKAVCIATITENQ